MAPVQSWDTMHNCWCTQPVRHIMPTRINWSVVSYLITFIERMDLASWPPHPLRALPPPPPSNPRIHRPILLTSAVFACTAHTYFIYWWCVTKIISPGFLYSLSLSLSLSYCTEPEAKKDFLNCNSTINYCWELEAGPTFKKILEWVN